MVREPHARICGLWLGCSLRLHHFRFDGWLCFRGGLYAAALCQPFKLLRNRFPKSQSTLYPVCLCPQRWRTPVEWPQSFQGLLSARGGFPRCFHLCQPAGKGCRWMTRPRWSAEKASCRRRSQELSSNEKAPVRMGDSRRSARRVPTGRATCVRKNQQ